MSVSRRREGGRRKRSRAVSGREAGDGASRRLHFTVGTGPSFDPCRGQLSLENDLRLLKAGILYADRMRMCSVGVSLTLRMLADARVDDLGRQLDYIECHLRENIGRDDPEAAETLIEFAQRYRELRCGRSLNREQVALPGRWWHRGTRRVGQKRSPGVA